MNYKKQKKTKWKQENRGWTNAGYKGKYTESTVLVSLRVPKSLETGLDKIKIFVSLVKLRSNGLQLNRGETIFHYKILLNKQIMITENESLETEDPPYCHKLL
jgi:hypothetical protein